MLAREEAENRNLFSCLKRSLTPLMHPNAHEALLETAVRVCRGGARLHLSDLTRHASVTLDFVILPAGPERSYFFMVAFTQIDAKKRNDRDRSNRTRKVLGDVGLKRPERFQKGQDEQAEAEAEVAAPATEVHTQADFLVEPVDATQSEGNHAGVCQRQLPLQ